jgi:hypothetical protein
MGKSLNMPNETQSDEMPRGKNASRNKIRVDREDNQC